MNLSFRERKESKGRLGERERERERTILYKERNSCLKDSKGQVRKVKLHKNKAEKKRRKKR